MELNDLACSAVDGSLAVLVFSPIYRSFVTVLPVDRAGFS